VSDHRSWASPVHAAAHHRIEVAALNGAALWLCQVPESTYLQAGDSEPASCSSSIHELPAFLATFCSTLVACMLAGRKKTIFTCVLQNFLLFLIAPDQAFARRHHQRDEIIPTPMPENGQQRSPLCASNLSAMVSIAGRKRHFPHAMQNHLCSTVSPKDFVFKRQLRFHNGHGKMFLSLFRLGSGISTALCRSCRTATLSGHPSARSSFLPERFPRSR